MQILKYVFGLGQYVEMDFEEIIAVQFFKFVINYQKCIPNLRNLVLPSSSKCKAFKFLLNGAK